MFSPMNDENNMAVTENDAERSRRQQVLRLGLIMCLLLMLLDGSGSNTNRNAPTAQQINGNVLPNDEVLLNDRILSALQASDSLSMRNMSHSSSRLNVTGIYRGIWGNINVEDYTKNKIMESGYSIVQLKTTAVNKLPGLLFVYGILKLYGGDNSDISFPMQGKTRSISPQRLLSNIFPFHRHLYCIGEAYSARLDAFL